VVHALGELGHKLWVVRGIDDLVAVALAAEEAFGTPTAQGAATGVEHYLPLVHVLSPPCSRPTGQHIAPTLARGDESAMNSWRTSEKTLPGRWVDDACSGAPDFGRWHHAEAERDDPLTQVGEGGEGGAPLVERRLALRRLLLIGTPLVLVSLMVVH
jgi:hypothetical protein